MTKVVKFVMPKAAASPKAAAQARTGAKPEIAGFNAMLRKMTSVTHATKADAATNVRGEGAAHGREAEVNTRAAEVARSMHGRVDSGSDEPPAAFHELLGEADAQPQERGDAMPRKAWSGLNLLPSELNELPVPADEIRDVETVDGRGTSQAPAVMVGLAALLLRAEQAVSRPADEQPRMNADIPVAPVAYQQDGAPARTERALPPPIAEVAAAAPMPAPPAIVQQGNAIAVAENAAPVVATVLARETYFVPPKPAETRGVVRAPEPDQPVRAEAIERVDEPVPPVADAAPQIRPRVAELDRDRPVEPRAERSPEPAASPPQAAAPTAPGGTVSVAPQAGLPTVALAQIGRAITSAADTVVTAAAPLAVPVPGVATQAVPGRVEAMTVRLDMPEHGALHVRMTLAGRSLSLQFRAERSETAHRLDHDRDELSAILTRAGYTPDGLTIQSRPAEFSAQSQQTGGQPSTAGGGMAEGQAGRGQRQSHDAAPQSSHDNQRQDRDEHAPLRTPAAGGLYV